MDLFKVHGNIWNILSYGYKKCVVKLSIKSGGVEIIPPELLLTEILLSEYVITK